MKFRKNCLFNAVQCNKIETTRFLLSHGANVNEKDNDGKTAHSHAILNRSFETAKILHDANAVQH